MLRQLDYDYQNPGEVELVSGSIKKKRGWIP
jgi:hypothetical protein